MDTERETGEEVKRRERERGRERGERTREAELRASFRTALGKKLASTHLSIIVIVAFLFSPWNGSEPVSISYYQRHKTA